MSSITIAASPGSPRLRSFATTGVCLSVITISFVTFLVNALLRPSLYSDFYMFYAGGALWDQGANPYDYALFRPLFARIGGLKAAMDLSGYSYPPQASVLFAMFSHFPVETARMLYGVCNVALLVVALILLGVTLARYTSIGLIEITFIVSLINTGVGHRIREGHVSMIAFVLVFATFLLAQKGALGWAGASLGAASYKPTFLPLYLGYYLLRGRKRLLYVCLGIGIILTLAPLLITSRDPVSTLMDWARMLGTFNEGAWNSLSPDFAYGIDMVHLEPLIHRIFNVQSGLSKSVSWIVILTLCGFAAYLIRRDRPSKETDLLDFGIVSALSLLAVYHRSYDVFLLFPGMLYLYIDRIKTADAATPRRWALFLLGIIAILTLPSDTPIRIAAFSPHLIDSHVWRIVAPLQTWASVAMLVALLWLKTRHVRASLNTAKHT